MHICPNRRHTHTHQKLILEASNNFLISLNGWISIALVSIYMVCMTFKFARVLCARSQASVVSVSAWGTYRFPHARRLLTTQDQVAEPTTFDVGAQGISDCSIREQLMMAQVFILKKKNIYDHETNLNPRRNRSLQLSHLTSETTFCSKHKGLSAIISAW